MTVHILTANDLKNGHVVFLAADGSWTPLVGDARLAKTLEEKEELQTIGVRAEKEQLVTLMEIIPAEVGDNGAWPVRNRERIRASGPTVRPDLGYQAERCKS